MVESKEHKEDEEQPSRLRSKTQEGEQNEEQERDMRHLDDRDVKLIRDCKYIAPRTGPTRLIGVSPATEAHRSKRHDDFDGNAQNLDRKKEFLREQALEKERQFKRNVSHLRTRIEAFRNRLEAEVNLRDEEYKEMKESLENNFENMRTCVDEEINASVAVIEEDWLPPPSQRLDEWKADFDHFVHVTVPETIENQSGRVTRHLIKAQETFEIDNAKLLKRESKIEQRFATHVKQSAQNMTEVIRKRKDCFQRLEDDMDAAETEALTSTDRHEKHCESRVTEVEDLQSGLAGIRSKADSQLLIAIEEAMIRLQNSVLTNFGNKPIENTE